MHEYSQMHMHTCAHMCSHKGVCVAESRSSTLCLQCTTFATRRRSGHIKMLQVVCPVCVWNRAAPSRSSSVCVAMVWRHQEARHLKIAISYWVHYLCIAQHWVVKPTLACFNRHTGKCCKNGYLCFNVSCLDLSTEPSCDCNVQFHHSCCSFLLFRSTLCCKFRFDVVGMICLLLGYRWAPRQSFQRNVKQTQGPSF